jgi:ribosomal protein L11 methylase PrmA
MANKEHLEALNKEVLEKLDAYIKAKGDAGAEHHEKVNTAKEKWQQAWNEFLETLLVLEKLEI